MHRLLKRQIRRHLVTTSLDKDVQSEHPELVGINELQPFFHAVSDAYEQMDQEREIIERSLDLVSVELSQRNESLREEIAKQEKAQQQLDESLSTLNATFDATGEALVVFDLRGRIVKFNQLAKVLFKFPNISAISNKTLPFISLKSLYRQLEDPSEFANNFKAIKFDPEQDIFGQAKMVSGKVYEFHSSPQKQEGKTVGRVWCFRDVSELKESAATIRRQAYYDSLTGLPNRILLDDRLKHAIQYAGRFDSKIAVLFIDLDDFKKVNDNAGHYAGDLVLKDVTSRIQESIREVDTLARLGGDEFVLLLESIQDSDIVHTICERIITSLAKPFSVSDNNYFISSSIGISVYPKDGRDQEELMRKADMAMYQSKALGKSTYQFFDDSLEVNSQFHLQLENQLRVAIQKSQFQLFYQPKVCLKNNKVRALEALIRWFDEDGKFVSPADFIPLAEQTGLIDKIGEWVLDQTCKQLAQWREQGLSLLPVSINVSPVEFNSPALVSRFETTLQKYDIPPETIEIEITESIFFEDIDKMCERLNKIRALGISVAVDDFGTGFSSLQYLHQLPIDVLKIDRSFIMDLENQAHNAAIADTIITLARNLNLKVVAEGVETTGAIEFLAKRECDLAQGFYFYKPMPVTDMTEILKTNVSV